MNESHYQTLKHGMIPTDGVFHGLNHQPDYLLHRTRKNIPRAMRGAVNQSCRSYLDCIKELLFAVNIYSKVTFMI